MDSQYHYRHNLTSLIVSMDAPAVLLIESDDLTRESIAYMLEVLKYRVTAVDTTEAALGALGGVFFDALIISLEKNDLDGSVIAMEAKKVQKQLKVVVVSGREPPEILRPFTDAFVRKPFSLQEIQDAVSRVLAGVTLGGI